MDPAFRSTAEIGDPVGSRLAETNFVEKATADIAAMTRGIHPTAENGLGRGITGGDVFPRGVACEAGRADAVIRRTVVEASVAEVIVVVHHLRIAGRRFVERRVATEAGQIAAFSLCIVQAKKRILIPSLDRLDPERCRHRVNRHGEEESGDELFHFGLKLPEFMKDDNVLSHN